MKLAINGGEKLRGKPLPIRRTMGDEEINAVVEVMKKDNVSEFIGGPHELFFGGEQVVKFENDCKELFKYKHAITTNSWTTGLMACVGAVGIGPGDEVICSPYTMSASSTSILFYGGIPVFADVDKDTYCLDPKSVEENISENTKAIMVVHLFGRPAPMKELRAIADKHGLKIIEDAAQAPLASYDNENVGALADIGGYSLNYHKHIHTGEGGVIVTNDDELATKARMIRNHGENCIDFLGVSDLTNCIGSNYRLTEIQAAIGIEQLKKLPGLVSTRRSLYSHFYEQMLEVEGISLESPVEGIEHSFYVVAMNYDSNVTGISRDKFIEAVNAEFPEPHDFEDIPFFPGYTEPLYLNDIYQKRIAIGKDGFPFTEARREISYEKGICPNCEDLYENILIYTPIIREPLEKSDIDDFCAAIKKVLSAKEELK